MSHAHFKCWYLIPALRMSQPSLAFIICQGEQSNDSIPSVTFTTTSGTVLIFLGYSPTCKGQSRRFTQRSKNMGDAGGDHNFRMS